MGYPSKDALERAKLTVELAAPFLLVTIIALALCNHAAILNAVGAALKDAKIEIQEADVLGIKAKFIGQTDEVRDLKNSVQEMVGRQAKAVEFLKCERTSTCDDGQKAAIHAFLGEPATPASVAETLDRSTQLLAASERTITKVENAQLSPKLGDWVIVLGADTSPAEAQQEISRARKTFPQSQVNLVLRGSWYRTVVHFGSADEARSRLGDLAVFAGHSPYVRNISEWCASTTSRSDGVVICTVPTGG